MAAAARTTAEVKLYKAYLLHPHEGTVYAWYATRWDANEQVVRWKEVYKDDYPMGVDVVTIGPTRTDLVAWLNLHFTHDNG